MRESNKIICPACGAEMNHHANKIDYSLPEERSNPVYGGVLQEAHTCPQCGHIELRPAG